MRLASHSLIEHDHQNHTYSIHPLVHHWSGTTMKGNKHGMRKLILTIIGLSFSLTHTNEDYKYRRKLLKHTTNSRASLKLEDINSLVGMHIAHIYGEVGHLEEAEALGVMAMEKRKRKLGDDHPDTLTSMHNLADTYVQQGRWGEAEALCLVVVERRKLVLGDDHPDTLESIASLANTYWSQGRWSDAEALHLVVLEKRKSVLGDDHPDTILSMGDLASTYSYQGRWKEAAAL